MLWWDGPPRAWWAAPLAILLLLASRGIAGACTCVQDGASCAAVDTAEIVFEGTVDTIVPAERRVDGVVLSENRVGFSSVRRLRGEADFVLTAPAEEACGFLFSRGERYLVFASKGADGRAYVSRCSLTRSVARAGHLLDAIQQATPDPKHGGRVFGTLRGESAAGTVASPVAGAQITLQGPVNRSTRTASDGTFIIRDLPTGSYSLRAEPPASSRHLWPTAADFSLTFRGRCSEHELFATSRGRIRGQIVDETGQPISGAHVQLITGVGPRGQPGVSLRQTARTDRQGRYEFARLPAGTYSAGVNLWDGPSAVSPYQKAVAKSTGDDYFRLPVGGDLTLPPLSVSLLPRVMKALRVERIDRSIVQRVRLSLVPVGMHDRELLNATPVAAQTGADGVATVEVWQDVPYLLTVGSSDKPLTRTRIVATPEPLTVTVP